MGAVSGGGGVCVSGFGVAFDARTGSVRDFVPKNMAGLLVEGKEAPGLGAVVVRSGDVTVKANLEFGFLTRDDGQEVNGVAPDNR